MPRMTTGERINERHMRRAALDFVIAVDTGNQVAAQEALDLFIDKREGLREKGHLSVVRGKGRDFPLPTLLDVVSEERKRSRGWRVVRS